MNESALHGQRKSRSCLIAALAMIGIVSALIVAAIYNYRVEQARWKEECARWQQEYDSEVFADIKSGETQVSLLGEPSNLLGMLASDEDCARNAQEVYFSSLDLQDPRFAQIKNLPNVRKIGFYDCKNIVAFLGSVNGMPSIDEVHFDGIRVTDDLLAQLISFPNLKKLGFAWLTQSQADWLKRELPNVIVEVDELYTDDLVPKNDHAR